MLTQKRALELLELDEVTGILRWRKNMKGGVKSGFIAGSIGSTGYLSVRIDGRLEKVHRIVFLMFHGHVPALVDHINGIKTDNRPANLRPATKSQNAANAKISAANTSGFKGVTWDAQAEKWRAQGKVFGKCKYLGLFDSAEEAGDVATKFRQSLHGEFARHE